MFKLDQKGLSLPIVLAVAAIIGANSYYFLLTQKNTSVSTALTKTNIVEDAEKRRIAAVLSDYSVCTANFKDKVMDTLKNSSASGITAITKSGINIIKVGTNFTNSTGSPAFSSNVDHSSPQPFSETSRVSKIYITEVGETAPGVPPQQVRASLRIELETLASIAIGSSGKKIKVISIPLFVEFDSYPATIPSPDTRKVVRCYARPDTALTQNGLFDAIKNSCLTNGTSTTQITNAGCEHTLTPLTCGPKNNFLNSVGINLSTNAIEFTCAVFETDLPSLMNIPCDPGKVAQAVVNSSLQCAYLNACTSGPTMGSAMIKTNAPAGYSCMQSCNSTDVWHATNTSGDGTSTCRPRLYNCAPGYYARNVKPNGDADCFPITTKNKACAVNEFATHFDTTSTTSDLLHCAAFTKARTCPTSPKFSYITSLSSTTPACQTMP